jgi:hypothetical protein
VHYRVTRASLDAFKDMLDLGLSFAEARSVVAHYTGRGEVPPRGLTREQAQTSYNPWGFSPGVWLAIATEPCSASQTRPSAEPADLPFALDQHTPKGGLRGSTVGHEMLVRLRLRSRTGPAWGAAWSYRTARLGGPQT